MIIIVTGPIHSGKTTFVLKLTDWMFNQELIPFGYVSPAVFENDSRAGYDLLELKTQQRFPLLRKKGNPGMPRIGAYFFIPSGLELASQIISDCPGNICIIDEIGPKELEGGGLWPPISKRLKSGPTNILFVIRDSLVKNFTSLFSDQHVYVIDIQNSDAFSRLCDFIQDNVKK
jgi:iron complex transport system ATP-binding protein